MDRLEGWNLSRETTAFRLMAGRKSLFWKTLRPVRLVLLVNLVSIVLWSP